MRVLSPISYFRAASRPELRLRRTIVFLRSTIVRPYARDFIFSIAALTAIGVSTDRSCRRLMAGSRRVTVRWSRSIRQSLNAQRVRTVPGEDHSWQAAHAEDADIARSMQTIAADETRHAALAWSIAKRAKNELDRDASRHVTAAMNETIRELEAAAWQSTHPDVVGCAGVPNAKTHRAMLRELRRNLWA